MLLKFYQALFSGLFGILGISPETPIRRNVKKILKIVYKFTVFKIKLTIQYA